MVGSVRARAEAERSQHLAVPGHGGAALRRVRHRLGRSAVLNHQQPARGFWRAHQMGLHITLKELKAVRLKVETFLSQLRGRSRWSGALEHYLRTLLPRSQMQV